MRIRRFMKDFWEDESGLGVVEVTGVVNEIFEKIVSQSRSV